MNLEKITSNDRLGKSLHLMQIMAEKVKNVCGLFVMSEEETYLAGIDRDNYSGCYSQYSQDQLFDSSEKKKCFLVKK